MKPLFPVFTRTFAPALAVAIFWTGIALATNGLVPINQSRSVNELNANQSKSKNFIRVDQFEFAHKTGMSRRGIQSFSQAKMIALIHSADIYQNGNVLQVAATQHGAGISTIVNQYDQY